MLLPGSVVKRMAMRQLQPVIWTKGTLLTPQHLQGSDRYLESSIQFKMEALNYRPWGIQQLTIDQEALAAGNISVARAVGLFPDGLPFDIPDSDPAPVQRPVNELIHPEEETLDVFLAIPDHKERGLNVSLKNHTADTRFRSEIVNLRDENVGGAEKPVQIARKNFKLLFGTESKEGCTALCIARLQRGSSGNLQLDASFVPPLLELSANEHLLHLTRRLVEILTAKSNILAGGRRQRSAGLADFTSADIASFWLLFTVNSHLPVLRHYYESRKVHPERLFRLLSELAGSLTTFSLKIQPRDLPPYNHEDLGGCFDDLDEKLRELLETVVPSCYVALPLKQVQPSIYATSIEDDKYLSGTKMFLAIASSSAPTDLAKKIPLLAKVGSASQVEQLVRRALPGMELTHVAKPPAAIPVKLSNQYFALNQSGAAWDGVTKSRNLAVHIPAEIPETQIELLILLPQSL